MDLDPSFDENHIKTAALVAVAKDDQHVLLTVLQLDTFDVSNGFFLLQLGYGLFDLFFSVSESNFVEYQLLLLSFVNKFHILDGIVVNYDVLSPHLSSYFFVLMVALRFFGFLNSRYN